MGPQTRGRSGVGRKVERPPAVMRTSRPVKGPVCAPDKAGSDWAGQEQNPVSPLKLVFQSGPSESHMAATPVD